MSKKKKQKVNNNNNNTRKKLDFKTLYHILHDKTSTSETFNASKIDTIIKEVDTINNPFRGYDCGPKDYVETCYLCRKFYYETELYSVAKRPVCWNCLDASTMINRIHDELKQIYPKMSSYYFLETCALCGERHIYPNLYNIAGYPVCKKCVDRFK